MKRSLVIALSFFAIASIVGILAQNLTSPQPAYATSGSVAGTMMKVIAQRGLVAATGVTGAVSGTTGLTTTSDIGIIAFENTSAVDMTVFSSDGALTKLIPAASFRVFDVKANGGVAFAPTTYKWQASSAASSGKTEVFAVPVR